MEYRLHFGESATIGFAQSALEHRARALLRFSENIYGWYPVMGQRFSRAEKTKRRGGDEASTPHAPEIYPTDITWISKDVGFSRAPQFSRQMYDFVIAPGNTEAHPDGLYTSSANRRILAPAVLRAARSGSQLSGDSELGGLLDVAALWGADNKKSPSHHGRPPVFIGRWRALFGRA